MTGSRDRVSPMALTMPWTGYGVYTSSVTYPLSRSVLAAAITSAGPANSATVPHASPAPPSAFVTSRSAGTITLGEPCGLAAGVGPCGWDCGSTPLTSAIAIIGRKRMNSSDSVKNRPKSPNMCSQSTQDGVKLPQLAGQEVAVQRRDDDDEALEPHADVHEDRRRRTASTASSATT